LFKQKTNIKKTTNNNDNRTTQIPLTNTMIKTKLNETETTNSKLINIKKKLQQQKNTNNN